MSAKQVHYHCYCEFTTLGLEPRGPCIAGQAALPLCSIFSSHSGVLSGPSWHTPKIPALVRLRQEDHQKFKASLDYKRKRVVVTANRNWVLARHDGASLSFCSGENEGRSQV